MSLRGKNAENFKSDVRFKIGQTEPEVTTFNAFLTI